MSYYIGSAFSSTGSSDFTCIFYDTTGYTADSTGFTGLDWTVASGFMYVGDDKGAIGWGKTTDGTTDVYTKLTVGATGFKNGIYADTNGLYAVVDGTAIPYSSWGSDPLYTQGDFQDSVIDRLATPPAGSNGNRYLIIATANGAWTGYEDYITEYQDAWVFIAPSEGMMTWVEDEDVYYVYSGSAWATSSAGVDYINDIGDVVISGTPADNEVLAYDTGGNWINQTAGEAGLATSGHTHTGVYEPYDTAIVKSDEAETITSTWRFNNPIDLGTWTSGNEPMFTFEGGTNPFMWRSSTRGAIVLGTDDSVAICAGDSALTIAGNVDMTAENLYLGADSTVYIYTDLQAGWASKKTFTFASSGNFIVEGTISEGGTVLGSKYLGISAKASDSDKLDNHDTSYFATSAHTHSYLNDIGDVNAGSPSDDDVLTWDDGTSKWIAQIPTGGGVSVADFEESRHIGSGNKGEITCMIVNYNTTTMLFNWGNDGLINTGATDFSASFYLPLPTTLISGEKLYITRVETDVLQAADNDELDRLYISGTPDTLSNPTTIDSWLGLNWQPNARYYAQVSGAGGKNKNFTGGVPIDCSSYIRIIIRLDNIVTNASGLRYRFPRVEYYYA